MKILLVDDDSEDAELFLHAVNEIDPSIQIENAKDGQHALEILEVDLNLPSVIFLDINMPRVNGWECLMKLKQNHRTKNIPVVMYSTSRHNDDKLMAKKLGAIHFMEKPYHFDELKEQILNGLKSVLSF
jgi:CheY-like chemotaxis protein